MSLVRSLVALTLLVALLGSPLAACALPFLEMTQEEEDCCREMAGDCGQMAMPESHSCCPEYTIHSDQPGLKPDSGSPAPLELSLAGVVPSEAIRLPGFEPDLGAVPERPPGSPPILHAILRI